MSNVSRAVGVVGVLVVALATAPLATSTRSTDWKALHRPLHLPRLAAGTGCPVSHVDRRVDWASANIFGGSGVGPGPVYPGLGPSASAGALPDQQYGGPWHGAKVFWYVLPRYRGPVLLRGRRLDGPERLGFNGRRQPAAELRIEPYDTVSWPGQPAGSRGIASGVRVLAAGCYGVQIDGTSFSRSVVFGVTLGG